MSAYDMILAAARFAEQSHGADPDTFVSTAPELYAIAARVASGDLDLSDMPEAEGGRGAWSHAMLWLEDVKGIGIQEAARKREGEQPLLVATE